MPSSPYLSDVRAVVIRALHLGQRTFCRNSLNEMSPNVCIALARSTSHEVLHSSPRVQNARNRYFSRGREESRASFIMAPR
jgi:hypothetical protein